MCTLRRLSLVALVLLTACAAFRTHWKSVRRPTRTVAVVAHRGAHEHAPENTLPAFQAAIDLGADYVELDMHMTSDGGLVIIHNPTVDARTNGKGAVREMTLAQIRALDAGIKFDSSFAGTKIPTADEALALMKGKVGVYLEVKSAPPESVVAVISRHDMFSSTIVYDDTSSLAAMKRADPRVRVMVPRPPSDPTLMPEVVARLHPDVFGSSHREITPEVVERCHAAGAKVFVNTLAADNPDGWSHNIACGADALETDRPTELLRFLRGQGLHR